MRGLSSAQDGADNFDMIWVGHDIDAATGIGVRTGMDPDLTLSVAALCLGISLTGAAMIRAGHTNGRERQSLGLVYGAFAMIISAPLVAAFAPGFYLFFLPLNLVMLWGLPPAVYHYVLARTAQGGLPQVPWRDLILPLAGLAV